MGRVKRNKELRKAAQNATVGKAAEQLLAYNRPGQKNPQAVLDPRTTKGSYKFLKRMKPEMPFTYALEHQKVLAREK